MLGHHQFTRSIIQSVAVEASGRVDTTLLFGEVENHEKIASRAKEEYADSVQSGTSSQIEKANVESGWVGHRLQWGLSAWKNQKWELISWLRKLTHCLKRILTFPVAKIILSIFQDTSIPVSWNLKRQFVSTHPCPNPLIQNIFQNLELLGFLTGDVILSL